MEGLQHTWAQRARVKECVCEWACVCEGEAMLQTAQSMRGQPEEVSWKYEGTQLVVCMHPSLTEGLHPYPWHSASSTTAVGLYGTLTVP